MAASCVYRAAGSLASRTLLRGHHAPPALWNPSRTGSTASYAQVLHNIPETQVTTLDNGLRVASEQSSHPTCTVGVWISTGSRYESENNNGVGNFVEHLAFKGTKKRPGAELEKEVESMGAHLNSYSSREQTAFYMKTLSKDLPKAIEILADIVQNSSFEDSQIEKERNVILQEMKESDGSLSNVVFDYLHTTAYQGTALAKTVQGTTTNVKRLARSDLTEYVETHYKAPRMVLAAAGGVNHKELVNLANQHFGSVPYQYKEDAIPVLPTCRFTGSEIRVRDDDLPLAHIAIAVEGPGWANPDNVPLMVANSIVGSYDLTFGGGKNLSSRLARYSAEYNVLHSFQNFNMCYSDTGLLGFYFVCEPDQIDHATLAGQEEWMNLCTNVTDGEVKRAKINLRTKMAAQLNGTTPICENIATHILNYGRRIPLAEWDARISEVDANTIRDVCYKYIYDRCPAVVAVGPVEAFYDYNWIRSRMYWLRY